MTSKPVILTVDDEPQVLNVVYRDLQRHYQGNYRIIKASSGAEALATVQQLKQRNTPLALCLVDQRMPQMTGTEFLAEARKFYPDARKVLLTAYADTEAAITSINHIGLDYYLMKPWDPPEQNLYPVLDDLLNDWQSTVTLPYEGIRVAGTLWSASSHLVKDFLAGNRIPYQWLDLEKDSEARQLVSALSSEPLTTQLLPVVFFPDGSTLIQPDKRTLAEKCGLKTQALQQFYDLIIVGAGPAGLSAAVYSAFDGLRVVLIEKSATGGQAGTTSKIDNYPGFPQGLSGSDLARRATIQAQRLGVEILTAQEVAQVRTSDPYRVVTLGDGSELYGHSVLIATGVAVSRLTVPGVQQLTGAGVYYGAAATEAMNYRGEHVVVVGGANSAAQAAVYLARFAARVTLVVRAEKLTTGMSQYMIDLIQRIETIDILTCTTVSAVQGAERLAGVTLQNVASGLSQTITAAAMFIFIGAHPHTELVADVVKRDEAGFILTGADLMSEGRRPAQWLPKRDPFFLETSVPGIFAAGDVRHNAVRRIGAAVGQGAMVTSFVYQYLQSV